MNQAQFRQLSLKKPSKQFNPQRQNQFQVLNQSFSSENKQNYDTKNISTLKNNDQKIRKPNILAVKQNQQLTKPTLTETTQQSTVVFEELSLSSVNFTESHAFDQQIPSKVQDQNLTKIQCINCQISKLQSQKQYHLKELELSTKHMQEKDDIRSTMNKKYNVLWQKYNQQSSQLIHLEHQNKCLKYQTQKLEYQFQNHKKTTGKTLSQKENVQKRKIQELMTQIERNFDNKIQQKDRVIEDMKDQCDRIKKVCQGLQSEKTEIQNKLKEKIVSLEEQHSEMLKNLKKNYESKLALIQKRHQSEISALLTESEMKEQIFVQEIQSYQQILCRKDQTIQKLFKFYEELQNFTEQKYQNQQQQISLQGYLKTIQQKQHIKEQLKNIMDKSLQDMQIRQQLKLQKHLEELKFSQQKNKILKEKCLKLEQKNIELETALFQLKNQAQETLQFQRISQKQPLIDELISQIASQKQELMRVIKRQTETNQRQIQTKQTQLSLLQELLCFNQQENENLKKSLSAVKEELEMYTHQMLKQRNQFVKIIDTKEHEHKQKIDQLNKKINSLENHQFELKKIVQEQKAQISDLKTLKDTEYCKNPQCLLAAQQLFTLQNTLPQSKIQIQPLVQNQNIQQILNQATLVHRGILEAIKQSYEKLLTQKNQQLRKSAQEIADLKNFNLILEQNCKRADREIQRVEKELTFHLTYFLRKQFQELEFKVETQ